MRHDQGDRLESGSCFRAIYMALSARTRGPEAALILPGGSHSHVVTELSVVQLRGPAVPLPGENEKGTVLPSA